MSQAKNGVNGFMLFTDQREYISLLDDAQQAELLRALYAYAAGEEPQITDKITVMAFTIIRQSIDRVWSKNAALAENGRKGRQSKDKQNEASASKTEQNEANPSKDKQVQANESKSPIKNKYEIKSEYEREGDIAPAQARAKPPKKKYGQFQNVLLTDEEYTKLVEHFGSQEIAATWIDRLDEYIGSKGAKYKSHYITILNWERKDAEAPHASASGYGQQLKFEQDQQARALLAASQRRNGNAQLIENGGTDNTAELALPPEWRSF